MVGYECSNCGGSGYEEITSFKRGDLKHFITNREKCSLCFGAGTFTNGKPDVDWDCGITDIKDNWRYKWGDRYENEVLKGLKNRGIL